MVSEIGQIGGGRIFGGEKKEKKGPLVWKKRLFGSKKASRGSMRRRIGMVLRKKF